MVLITILSVVSITTPFVVSITTTPSVVLISAVSVDLSENSDEIWEIKVVCASIIVEINDEEKGDVVSTVLIISSSLHGVLPFVFITHLWVFIFSYLTVKLEQSISSSLAGSD